MQNLFMPSETVACIEQKYVGKTYKIKGKAYTEPFTKEKILALFNVYVDAINQVFGERAIVMQRTRALKNGTMVPITSFEYVYGNKQSIISYVDQGYYAITINGYRMRDIMDSAYHYFTDSLSGAGKIIESISMTLDMEKENVKGLLINFFCDNDFESFDDFLRHIMTTGRTDMYLFDVCASVTCAFGEPVPVIGSCTEIQTMNRRAQDAGLAVDECDLDGWKGTPPNGTPSSRNKRNVCDFFEKALEYHEKFCCPTPADEEEKSIVHDCESCVRCDEKSTRESCDPVMCDEPDEPDEENDDLDEIRKDIDSESIKKCTSSREPNTVNNNDDEKYNVSAEHEDNSRENDMVDISSMSDGNNYTYTITWTDKNGKSQTKTFYGDAAKKMMSNNNMMFKDDDVNDDDVNDDPKDDCDEEFKLYDVLKFLDKRIAKLEQDTQDIRERSVRIRRDPFALFGLFHDPFDGF